ncbi:PTS sugar transporter subunit IIB [Lactobacillus sp. DCY120]|uniref:PTS sugar transporter subunit IIB n=1 Tax=Bombilactobacillus apium TaxID=2675299 RepID=A0A850QWB2_9LACO|nr:PTS sugar transporter subunit IIB [Bombilactobacillus apium]NVY96084.1 PTS sugar transporter subunit IIB [Bombilactobacillus apium]
MIVFSRIDDRLIHGQVVTTWVNAYKIEQIIILNDRIAQDPVQQNILKMAAPQGIKVQAFGIEKFGQIIQKTPIKRRTMLIFANSIDAWKTVEAGVEISELNVGGMRYQEGRTRLTTAVAVTPTEREAFEELLAQGTKVQIQMVPNSQAVDLEEVLR